MSNVALTLPGLPRDLPPQLLRYLTVADTLLRGLNSYAIDYTALDNDSADDLAQRLAERPQSARYIMRVLSCVDVSLSTPPGTPTEGTLYYVNGTGTGAWATLDAQIVLYTGGAWTALGDLQPGQIVWDEATEVMHRAGNDGTLSNLAPTAQAMVNSIQADATALADLNTTLRRTSDWVQALQASQSGGSMTLTRPTGWTEYFYFGGYWDSNTPVLTWHAGTSSAATVVLGNVSGASPSVFAASNNRFLAIRIS